MTIDPTAFVIVMMLMFAGALYAAVSTVRNAMRRRALARELTDAPTPSAVQAVMFDT